jgi:hypothetical protein
MVERAIRNSGPAEQRGSNTSSIIWAGTRGKTRGKHSQAAHAAGLRVVRPRTAVPSNPLIVVGIDDWPFLRNHHYGTIVCDLERRRIATLLPESVHAGITQPWSNG